MLARAVKPTRRRQTAKAPPAISLVGLTYRTAVCGTRLYGGVAGEERRLSPLCRLLPDLQSGDLRIKQLQFGIVLDGREHLSHDALIDF